MYLADEHKIWVCKGEDKICMLPKMANRHGLIAGATGTGKTVTLKVLAESFSEMGRAGIPVHYGAGIFSYLFCWRFPEGWIGICAGNHIGAGESGNDRSACG